jgi:hypothetical protein
MSPNETEEELPVGQAILPPLPLTVLQDFPRVMEGHMSLKSFLQRRSESERAQYFRGNTQPSYPPQTVLMEKPLETGSIVSLLRLALIQNSFAKNKILWMPKGNIAFEDDWPLAAFKREWDAMMAMYTPAWQEFVYPNGQKIRAKNPAGVSFGGPVIPKKPITTGGTNRSSLVSPYPFSSKHWSEMKSLPDDSEKVISPSKRSCFVQLKRQTMSEDQLLFELNPRRNTHEETVAKLPRHIDYMSASQKRKAENQDRTERIEKESRDRNQRLKGFRRRYDRASWFNSSSTSSQQGNC